jgi:predicted house-cleaning noncanonical NTP pyrophosphatase (MazG superfamily)
MSEKVYNKLVRDGIPEIIEAKGHIAHTRLLEEQEYRQELLKKLIEEAQEASETKSDEELFNELADILEVIYAALVPMHRTRKALELAREKKLRERGGFISGIFLESVVEKDEN